MELRLGRPTMESSNAAGGPDNQPEVDPIQEAARRSHNNYSRENHPFIEHVLNATLPSELFRGLREMTRLYESPVLPSSLKDTYALNRLVAGLFYRDSALKVSVNDLTTRRDGVTGVPWVIDYNPETGTGVPTQPRYAEYAIGTSQKLEWQVVSKRIGRDGTEEEIVEERPKTIYHFEVPKGPGQEATRRKDLQKAYERATTELAYRYILGNILGIVEDYRDDLGTMVTYLFQRAPHYKIPHMEIAYNLPDIDKVDSNPEDTGYGDKLEVATWWYLAMLRSGTKSGMKDFIDRLATDGLAFRGLDGPTREKMIKLYIGDVDTWVEDSDRIVGGSNDSVAQESRDGKRGLITKYGNIPANGALSDEDERTFIEMIGRLCGSLDAAWMALAKLKGDGVFADEGVVFFNGTDPEKAQVALKLGSGGNIEGDDRGKLHVAAYMEKERRTGRLFGPPDLVGKNIPDMGLSFMSAAIVKKEIVGATINPNGTRAFVGGVEVVGAIIEGGKVYVERSVLDAWLGFKRGKVTDPHTKQEIDCPQEDYLRLGSLNYKSMKAGVHSDHSQLTWLAGRPDPGKGVFEILTDVAPDPRSLDEAGLRKRRKFFTIVYNPLIALRGVFRGIAPSSRVGYAEGVQSSVMRNWWSAVQKLTAFITDFEGQMVKVLDPKQTTGVGEKPKIEIVRKMAKLLGFEDTEFDPKNQRLDKDDVRNTRFWRNRKN